MPKPVFVNEQFYHVYNRGTDKRVIFQNENDYLRFVKDLYEFNDFARVVNLHRINVRDPILEKERDLLVDIVAWCLMPNHFHLILRQRQENGISLFLQKLGIGYTMYFNKKYERSGVLFQGATKTKLISGDAYLMHSVRYVHLNPVSLIEPGWEKIGITNWATALDFLKHFKWSSHLDFLGVPNFSEIINTEFLPKYQELNQNYSKFLAVWISKNKFFVRDPISNKD